MILRIPSSTLRKEVQDTVKPYNGPPDSGYFENLAMGKSEKMKAIIYVEEWGRKILSASSPLLLLWSPELLLSFSEALSYDARSSRILATPRTGHFARLLLFQLLGHEGVAHPAFDHCTGYATRTSEIV